MNNKQRKYTEDKIVEYTEEIRNLEYRINRNALFSFLGTGMAIAIFALDGEIYRNEVLDNIIGITSAASVIYNATSAVRRIAEKASFEHTKRVLEYNLELNELEEEHPKQYVKAPKK